MTTSPMNKNVS